MTMGGWMGGNKWSDILKLFQDCQKVKVVVLLVTNGWGLGAVRVNIVVMLSSSSRRRGSRAYNVKNLEDRKPRLYFDIVVPC